MAIASYTAKDGHGTVEEILAGLQVVSPSLAAQKFKRDPAAHDAVFGQQARDRALRRAARDIHVDSVARESLIRLVQRQVEISAREDQKNQEEEEGPAHISLAIRFAPARGPNNLAG